jgi:hypothetical protein
MKTAKQIIKKYLDKEAEKPVEGMAVFTKEECEILMEQYLEIKTMKTIAIEKVDDGSELSFYHVWLYENNEKSKHISCHSSVEEAMERLKKTKEALNSGFPISQVIYHEEI